MNTRLSVRARLTMWFAAVLAICLAAAGLTVWTALRQSMLNNIDRDLQGRLAGLIRILQNESPGGEPSLVRVELEEYAAGLTAEQSVRCRDAPGHLLFSFPASRPARSRSGSRSVTLSGHTYELEVGTSLNSLHEMLRLLSLIMLISVPLILLLASLGGWWLSRRALAPVDAMTREANQLGIRNLEARLPEPGTGDELDRFAQAWNRLLARLQAAVERLIRFTGDASHELRSPVALIRTTAELALRQDRSPEEYRRALAQIEAESRRMTELIEDLLALARSDEGAPALEPVELNEAIERACSEKRAMADNKGVSLAVDAGEETMEVLGAAAMLKRIIVLLVDNAVKYTPPGGNVVVQARRLGDAGVLVKISDTGVGIAPENLPHVFERFWRADPARSGGGSGLGLALAQAIAEAHGGTLEVRSNPGQGSTFSFTLAAIETARPVT